jgi:hypothetical protein
MTNQFGMGPMGMGSLSGMLESVELLKKAWSGFSLPASFAPTMDLDELDKRIADLKTVEQWLTMNLTLLRGTVQGMEIQRGTVAALKAFGASMGSDDLARGAFAAAAQAAAANAAASATGAAPAAAPAPAGGAASSQPTGQPGPDAADPSAAAAELTRAAAAAVNPATWWNLLQTQFAQVAQGAAATASGESAAAAAAGASASATPAAATARKAAPRKARAAAAPRPAAAPRAPKTPAQPAAEAAPATGIRPRSRR